MRGYIYISCTADESRAKETYLTMYPTMWTSDGGCVVVGQSYLSTSAVQSAAPSPHHYHQHSTLQEKQREERERKKKRAAQAPLPLTCSARSMIGGCSTRQCFFFALSGLKN